MTAKSHLTTTLAIGILPLYFFRNEMVYMFDYVAIYVIGLVIGSLLPDIEESNSVVGRQVPLLSEWLNKKIGHRTYTHNILFYLAIFVFAYYQSLTSSHFIYVFLIGFSLGSILHTLEDCLTNSGVSGAMKPLLDNFVILKKEYRFNTDSVFENYVYYPIVSLFLIAELFLSSKYILNF